MSTHLYPLVDAANIPPPMTVYEVAIASASANFQLPDAFKNGWITLQADSTDCWIKFGTSSAVTAEDTATSTLTANVIGAATNGSWMIPSGQERTYYLGAISGMQSYDSSDHIWLARIRRSSTATGRLRFYLSSGQST